MDNRFLHTKRLVITAMFLSIALVLNLFFTHDIPLFGERGMRIGISGVFTIMPSILFGPVYGALTNALRDVLGFVLRPTGPYLWQITVIMAAGGFIRGSLWMVLRNKSSMVMRSAVAAFSVLVIAAGIYNTWAVNSDNLEGFFDPYVVEIKAPQAITEPVDWREKEPGLGIRTILRVKDPAVVERAMDESEMRGVNRVLVGRVITLTNPGNAVLSHIVTLTVALIGTGILGMILLAADLMVSAFYKRRMDKQTEKPSFSQRGGRITALVIAMVVSGLIVTTLNTVVLRAYIFPAWQLIPFYLVWLPRAVQEIVVNIVLAYFVTVLYSVFESHPFLRKLIN